MHVHCGNFLRPADQASVETQALYPLHRPHTPPKQRQDKTRNTADRSHTTSIRAVFQHTHALTYSYTGFHS